MTPPSRTKRFVYATVGGLGLFAGAAGIAAAATRQPSPSTPPSASTEVDHGGVGEQSDGRDHSYTSSVTLPDAPGAPELSDSEEAKQLQSLAKASAADAEAAATAAVPGKAAPAQLEDEDGNVVWKVEVTAADGRITEVVVDAGNAKVLHQEAEGAEDHEDGTHDDGKASNRSGGPSEVQDPTTSAVPAN